METKIMLGAALFFGGWLLSYLFIRQFLFNLLTAFPLIRKMQALQADLIAVGAKRYTIISSVVCCLLTGIVFLIVLRFCPLYQIICFAIGVISALLMLVNKLGPANRPVFDSFCTAYCRFVPDDELRTAMYNKKTGQMKSRLKAMEIQGSFIPEFK